MIAAIYNRRFGLRTYRWLQSGLDVLGNPKSVQASWIGFLKPESLNDQMIELCEVADDH